MSEFYEWFENEMPNSHKKVGKEKIETVIYSCAESAWNHKQAKVDELQKNLNNAIKTIEIQQRFLDDADGANEIATSQVNELQNKIDEALKLLNLAYPESWAYCVDEAINILEGDQS